MTPTTDLIGACFICRRQHNNIGYAPHDRAAVKWVCIDCLYATHDPDTGRSKMPRIYHMPRKQFNDYEHRALEDGGNAGGEFLDSIGKTDLASLSEDEWREFLSRVLAGYADGMREIVKAEVPF